MKAMRMLTPRDRLVLLVAVLQVALAVTCAACAAPSVLGARASTPRAEYTATVEIHVTCPDGQKYSGSGVIVSEHHVATAAHVVTCADGRPATVITVDPTGGDPMVSTTDVLLPTRDIARLVVGGDLSRWYQPITLAPEPDIGDELCEAAADPRWDYRCGKVERVTDSEVAVSMVIEPGNSGSGVYDSRGRLVGLMVNAYRCEGDVHCSGNIARTTGLGWLSE